MNKNFSNQNTKNQKKNLKKKVYQNEDDQLEF